VKRPGVDPEAMGNYFRDKKQVAASEEDHPYAGEIRSLVANAWAVRDYLKACGE
jgi:hypothetical protein